MSRKLFITQSGAMGLKKPALWVHEGNTGTKIASFNSEKAKDLFLDVLREMGMAAENDIVKAVFDDEDD